MSDFIRIKVYVDTGYAACGHSYVQEIQRKDWDAMSEYDRNLILNDLATDYMNECIECGAYVIEEEE